MKRRFFCAVTALLMLLSRTAAEQALTPAAAELVRLHVVAADDTDSAQALKLKVRDAVLAESRQLLEDCGSADDAWEILSGNLDGLEAVARACAEENGFFGPVTAALGVYDFPDREYDGVTVPAGDYRALRVTLGEGAGQNWWCVLYPSLCMPSEDGYRSLIAEWFERWFGGE